MLPEGKLVRGELLIRELALPEDVKLTKKSLVRWVALSLGLISPNESRTILLDVLEALINFHIKKIQPTTKDIINELARMGVEADEKTVYYHLLRMKEAGVVGKRDGKHFFADGEEGKLSEMLRRVYQQRFDRSFDKIAEALNVVESYKR